MLSALNNQNPYYWSVPSVNSYPDVVKASYTYPGDGPDFVGQFTLEVSGSSPPQPDFGVDASKIDLVQVISRDAFPDGKGDGKPDTDINGDGILDLVVGKPTIVKVPVTMENYSEIPKEHEVKIRITFCGVCYEQTLTIQKLESTEFNPVKFFPDNPTIANNYTLTVDIIPGCDDSNEDNNHDESIDFTVWETRDPRIVYFPVASPTALNSPVYCYLNSYTYNSTVENSNKFIKGVYPISDSDFSPLIESDHYHGVAVPIVGMGIDFAVLWSMAALLTGNDFDAVVGIVPAYPQNYFDFHLQGDTAGIRNKKSILVLANKYTTTAHELGHVFYLDEQYVPDSSFYTGYPTYGYWVSEERPVSDPIISNGACFMGEAPTGTWSHSSEHDNRKVWVCSECYNNLFKTLTQNDGVDPDLLLIHGIINKNDNVQLGRLYMIKNGVLGNIEPGEYSVEFIDRDGLIITGHSFDTDFLVYSDPGGIIETDYALITIAVPYPHEAVSLRIKYRDVILTTINPNSGLLRGAIESVPDNGFRGPSDQRRKALYNKIDEFERMLEVGDIRDAYNKLIKDIRNKIEQWLGNYSKENPGQLTKTEILELIDEIASRLKTIGNLQIVEDQSITLELIVDDLNVSNTIIPLIEETQVPPETTVELESTPDLFDPEKALGFMLFETGEIIGGFGIESFINEESLIELTTEMEFIFSMIEEGMYVESLILLENDILQRMDGCANIGQPDKDDWITSIEGQALLYPLVIETIELLESML